MQTIRDSKAILSPLSDARKGTVPAGTCLQPDLRSAGSPGTERNGLCHPSDGAVREPDRSRDLEKLEDFYWHGYEEAKRLYPQLHAWLEQREECVSRKRLLGKVKRMPKSKDSGCGKKVSVLP